MYACVTLKLYYFENPLKFSLFFLIKIVFNYFRKTKYTIKFWWSEKE